MEDCSPSVGEVLVRFHCYNNPTDQIAHRACRLIPLVVLGSKVGLDLLKGASPGSQGCTRASPSKGPPIAPHSAPSFQLLSWALDSAFFHVLFSSSLL